MLDSKNDTRRMMQFAAGGLLLSALALGVWQVTKENRVSEKPVTAVVEKALTKPPKSGTPSSMLKNENSASATDNGQVASAEVVVEQRQPLLFRAKPVAAAAVLDVLSTGPATVDQRVARLQGMRGISLSPDERAKALRFLAGQDLPTGSGKGSQQWLADELLTVVRLQQPKWDGLAKELGRVAFEPDTDPVVRDYIMQHLGHLWEQFGAQEEIEKTLWQALTTTDETTPGTALIALSLGYGRDKQDKKIATMREKALALAMNPENALAVRVTALSIAGDGGGEAVKKLATNLVNNRETPLILRNVAERALR